MTCAVQENIYRNFGMPQPNGYRKALRFMKHADHFGFPIVTFVDTPGAYAGKNAEELGQVLFHVPKFCWYCFSSALTIAPTTCLSCGWQERDAESFKGSVWILLHVPYVEIV